MESFLLTWNPSKWHWSNLNDCIEDTQAGLPVNMSWSTGGIKRVQPDDLAFLMRLGNEPRGVIGYGSFTSSHYVGAHWSKEPGKVANYAKVEFKMLMSEEDIIDLELLKELFPQMNWTPQASGISIPNDTALKVLRMFKRIMEKAHASKKISLLEGSLKRVVVDKRERNSEARRKCIDHYGHVCAICKFDFEEFYGDIGRDFIHVHHLDPISNAKEKREIDPIQDLIPICANCHSIIHRRKIPYTIAEVKSMISAYGKWIVPRRRS